MAETRSRKMWNYNATGYTAAGSGIRRDRY